MTKGSKQAQKQARQRSQKNRSWLALIRVAFVLLWIYAIFLCGFYVWQFDLMVRAIEPIAASSAQPRDDSEKSVAITDYELQPVDVADSEARIHGRIYKATLNPNDKVQGLVAYLHDYRDSIDQCRSQIDIFLEADFDVAVLEYRGKGQSSGPVAEDTLQADALRWYNDLQAKGYTEKEIIIWGRSFGTGLAAYIASQHKPRMLVLETPYYSLVDTFRSQSMIAWLVPDAFIRFRFPTYAYEPNIETSVHLIHGDKDEQISYESSERLKTLWQKSNRSVTIWRIPTDDHNLRESPTESKPEFYEALKQILTIH